MTAVLIIRILSLQVIGGFHLLITLEMTRSTFMALLLRGNLGN